MCTDQKQALTASCPASLGTSPSAYISLEASRRVPASRVVLFVMDLPDMAQLAAARGVGMHRVQKFLKMRGVLGDPPRSPCGTTENPGPLQPASLIDWLLSW